MSVPVTVTVSCGEGSIVQSVAQLGRDHQQFLSGFCDRVAAAKRLLSQTEQRLSGAAAEDFQRQANALIAGTVEVQSSAKELFRGCVRELYETKVLDALLEQVARLVQSSHTEQELRLSPVQERHHTQTDKAVRGICESSRVQSLPLGLQSLRLQQELEYRVHHLQLLVDQFSSVVKKGEATAVGNSRNNAALGTKSPVELLKGGGHSSVVRQNVRILSHSPVKRQMLAAAQQLEDQLWEATRTTISPSELERLLSSMESVQKAVTIRIKELTASVSELEEAQHGNGSPRLDPEDSFIDGYGRLCLSPSRSNSDDIYGAGEQALLAQSSESFDEAEIERLKTKLSMSSASQSGDKSISRKASKALINSDLEMRAYYFSQALSAKKKRWCAIRARTVRDSKPALSMQRFEEFLEDSEGHSSAEWAAKQDWLRFARHGEFESRSPQAPPIRIHSEIQGMKSPGDWRHIKPFMTSSPATHHSKHVSALGIPSLSENRSVLLEASRAIDNYHTSRDTEVLKRIILDIHKRLVQEEAAFLEEERKEREKASQIKPPLSTGLPDLTVIEMSDKDAIASSFIPPSNGRKLERKASLASFDAEGDRKTSKSSESSRPIGPDKSNYREVSNINSESTPKSIVGATSTINPADRVRAIYEQCNPSKLGEVPQLLQKYAGQERTLIAKLEKKYAAQLAASSANLLLQSAGSLNFSTSSSTTSSSPFQQLQSSSSGPSLFQSNSSSTKMGGESQTLSQPCSSLFGGSNSSSDNASLFGAKSNLFQTPSASSSNALGGATIRSGAENAVSRITAIYQQHNPSKLGEIPQLLEKYKGRELELLSKVERKYNIQQQPQSGGVFATSQVQGSQPSGTGAGSLFGKSTSATTAGPFASWGNQQSAATNLSGSSSLFSGGTNAVASTPFATPNNGAGGSSLFSGGNPMNTGGTESIPTPFATNKSNSSGGSITSFGGGFAKAFGSSTATAPGFKPTPFSGGSTPFSGSSNTGLFQGGSANKGSPFGSTIQQNSLFDGANSSGFGGANKTPTPFGGGIGMTGGGAAKPSLWGKK